TFKDRILLEHGSFAILEELLISGYAIGAPQGFIYIRSEIKVKALVTKRSRSRLVFIPMHFAEAVANELTLDTRNPQAKIHNSM
ncbi:MAG: hypothetical protein L3J16_03235, partial [Anaerolineales bacterium]|nr:hypothetical protein [Anaerolineales bacterium]